MAEDKLETGRQGQHQFVLEKNSYIQSVFSFSTEKLAVNGRSSSPSIVRTFLGFHTSLICAFMNGVPPIVVTIKKGQLTLKTIQEQNINSTLKLSVTSFEKYTCKATDFTGIAVKHVIEVKQASKC